MGLLVATFSSLDMLTSSTRCVWLGEGDASSAMAIKFIKDEVLQLQNFDDLCDSKEASKKWGALLELMQRKWFSRRWVVQEIALAQTATIYCGTDFIPVSVASAIFFIACPISTSHAKNRAMALLLIFLWTDWQTLTPSPVERLRSCG
jgi:hypothetical protein